MLCESCQARVATVHLTLVLGPSDPMATHDFCESCYPEAEAARLKSYNLAPNRPPFSLPDVENLTALEYLAAADKAGRNSADKPVFEWLNEDLARLPNTQQRLAFEMLPLAWETLERGEEPGWEVAFAGSCHGSIEPGRLPEYTTWLEKIILRCFELRSQLPNPPGEFGPFALPLCLTLTCLGEVDRNRLEAVLGNLKRQMGEASGDPRWKIIATAAQRLSRPDG